VHPITDLQIEYSIVTRGAEEKIFPTLEELGIGVTAYGILSRGLLSGSKPGASQFDLRKHLPRFSGDNFEQNQQLIAALDALANEKGVTKVQLAVAWVLAKRSDTVAVIGARTRKQLEESLGALDVKLSGDEIARIEEAVPPVAGTRYDANQMRMLDSEK
jgi:aryl-alcohol dehydrogenase-like predicted oxidoreductase